MSKITTLLLLLLGILSACSNLKNEDKSTESKTKPTNTVVHSSEINWEKLNPARGDQSPQAGSLWGNRKDTVPTGFLAKFVNGFSSPPHIHNVTYRAVVIKGELHNADPKAENSWMQAGSFWTQPAGAAHITAANGIENIALVEIDRGPYLVKPIEQANANREKPINIDASNLVWINKDRSNWINPKSNAAISFLSENNYNSLKSLFVRLPKGHVGTIETSGTVLHAVVIKGTLNYTMPQNNSEKHLDAGSYFGATGATIHRLTISKEAECILYIRTNGKVLVHGNEG